MYKEKWLKGFRRKSGKSIALLVSLVLIIGVIVGGAIAFLIDTTGSVNNQFTPSKVTTEVTETCIGTTKSDVAIKNTGDTEAWIRAAVVVTWQDKDGNVYGQKPVESTDYSIDYNLSPEPGAKRWIKGADNFYYWTSPVLSDDENATDCSTGVLINSCTTSTSKTVGTGKDAVTYYLTVEIIGSGIQSVPTSVVTKEWSSGVSGVSDDTLTIKQQGGAGN